MEKLKVSLEKLHQELKEAKQVDEDSKNALRELMNDIQTILDKNEKDAVREHHNLLESLKESSQKFELTHPELAGAINIVISSLSNLGI
jgi:predicted  nucleic acid-binding Zn-ribbon protein